MTDEQIYKLACKAADTTPLGIDGRPRQIVCSEGKDSKGNPITIQLTWGFQYEFLRNFLKVVADSQVVAEPPNFTTDVVEPEPVAYTEIKDGYPKSWLWNPEYVKAHPNAKVKLYTEPPKREWVGLSYEDVVKAKKLAKGANPEYAVAFVTFRLKEYNT